MPGTRLCSIRGNKLGKFVRNWMFASAVFTVSACTSTVVVLVPDPDGKVGEVEVSTAGGETTLSEAGESTQVSSKSSSPSRAEVLDETEIDDLFSSALQHEPIPPKRYILYFHFDSAKLSPEAVKLVPEMYQDLNTRPICDVSVIGHSDTTGDSGYNQSLSLRRAQAVVNLLVKKSVPKECLDIRYYGERDPLVPTPDGVPEPRNRRVEVEVR